MTTPNPALTTPMTQLEIQNLRNDDPIAWLRDKVTRHVPIDVRHPNNALAVLRICALAEAALNAGIVVCECKHGAAGSHDEECPCVR